MDKSEFDKENSKWDELHQHSYAEIILDIRNNIGHYNKDESFKWRQKDPKEFQEEELHRGGESSLIVCKVEMVWAKKGYVSVCTT